MSEQRDSYGEIILGGVALPLAAPMSYNNLATFQRKLVIGDPGMDANPLQSAWVMSDFSGGSGVMEMNESTDVARNLISSLYDRYPKIISKPPKATIVHDGSALTSPWFQFLGDLKLSGTWYAIYSGDAGLALTTPEVYSTTYDGTPTNEGTLTTFPVNQGVVFRGTGSTDKLFIPMGASGYATVEAAAGFPFANVAADATHPTLVHAITFGYKLVGIDTYGQLWQCTDGSTWAKYVGRSRLPTTETPRKLIPYFDRNGQPAIYILSDVALRQFDEDGPLIFDIDVSFPPHPFGGRAGCKWNGDIYFSVGMGVYRYTGGSLSSVGLDRDAGLPLPWSGYIADLVPGHNALYALVMNPGDNIAWDLPGTPSIHEYNGQGWHMIWSYDQDTPASDVNSFGDILQVIAGSMGVSRYGNQYSLLWGTAGGASEGLMRMDLSMESANPRNIRNITSEPFASGTFFLLTGVFDAGMRGMTKVASGIDVDIEAIHEDATLAVYYRTDNFDAIPDATTWTLLVTINGDTGSHHLPFGTENAAGVYPGVTWESIQFLYVLTDASNDPFIMRSGVFNFVKTLAPSDSWTAQIDLSHPHVESPQVLYDHIKALMDARVMTSLVWRGQTYRVLISQISGTMESGDDERNAMTLSMLEIPHGLDVA